MHTKVANEGRVGSIMENTVTKFEDRVSALGEEGRNYFALLNEKLMSYSNVKARFSGRACTYSQLRKQLAKITIGGKTLKVHLALPLDNEECEILKLHPRDVSKTLAYQRVPFMVPAKSSLGVRKLIGAIDITMRVNGVAKKN